MLRLGDKRPSTGSVQTPPPQIFWQLWVELPRWRPVTPGQERHVVDQLDDLPRSRRSGPNSDV